MEVQALRALSNVRRQGVKPGSGVVDIHLAGARGVEHSAVWQHREAHRFSGPVVQ